MENKAMKNIDVSKVLDYISKTWYLNSPEENHEKLIDCMLSSYEEPIDKAIVGKLVTTAFLLHSSILELKRLSLIVVHPRDLNLVFGLTVELGECVSVSIGVNADGKLDYELAVTTKTCSLPDTKSILSNQYQYIPRRVRYVEGVVNHDGLVNAILIDNLIDELVYSYMRSSYSYILLTEKETPIGYRHIEPYDNNGEVAHVMKSVALKLSKDVYDI